MSLLALPCPAHPEPVEGCFRTRDVLRKRSCREATPAQDERFRPIRLAGYAALFHRRDAGGDIIQPGAFGASLARRLDPLPLLWQHRPHLCIGRVERAEEDGRGLRIIARLDRAGSRHAVLLRQGAVRGLSFGYRAKAYRSAGRDRVLSEIELFEVSLVTDPLQPGARVHLIT